MKLKHMTVLANVISIAAAGPLAARAQDAAPPEFPEYRIKAAFLYHFVQFVEWPPRAFANSGSPLVIGIVGEDRFAGALDAAMRGKAVNGHSLVIRHPTRPAELKNCHVLFVGESEKRRVSEIIAAAGGAPVLTVGECDRFLQSGGMINFVIEGGAEKNVRFEINNDAARPAGLKISSRLLALAWKKT